MVLKTGEIYAEIANIYGKPIEGGPKLVESWQKVAVLVKMMNFGLLERTVKLEPIVSAGLLALEQGLEDELGQSLPLGYGEFVLYGAECEPLELDFSGAEHRQALERVLMMVTEAMHDAWVKEHLGDFEHGSGVSSEERLKDIQFKRLFVPFPLLGWKIGKRYERMALALLGKVSLPQFGERAQKAYEHRTKEFCSQNGISDIGALQKKLMMGSEFYCVLCGDAEEKLARRQSTLDVARACMRELALKN